VVPAGGLAAGAERLGVRPGREPAGGDVGEGRGRDLGVADVGCGEVGGQGRDRLDEVLGGAQHRDAQREQLDEVVEVAEAEGVDGEAEFGRAEPVALRQPGERRRPHRALQVHVQLALRQAGQRPEHDVVWARHGAQA
jgi:hypothetical protein